MRRSMLFLVPLALLVAAAPASGGGFATVGLSSTPDGVAAGRAWTVDVTVLAHGRTPVDGLAPKVRIRSGEDVREFAATPAGETGVYRAEVVFPSPGRWSYQVVDGYVDNVHRFPAVQIGEAATSSAAGGGGGGGDGIATGWLWGAGAALLLALAALGLDRRRERATRARTGTPEPA